MHHTRWQHYGAQSIPSVTPHRQDACHRERPSRHHPVSVAHLPIGGTREAAGGVATWGRVPTGGSALRGVVTWRVAGGADLATASCAALASVSPPPAHAVALPDVSATQSLVGCRCDWGCVSASLCLAAPHASTAKVSVGAAHVSMPSSFSTMPFL
eukprot:m.1222264 g.1222264  ORF g.1222264 m.1222264 type:complete len:156 (-) comp24624_c0_seq63:1145-1612(-)